MKKNIYEIVEETLKQNSKYVSEDGKLLKATVYSDVMNMDKALLQSLLSVEKVKDIFFEKVDDTLIFDKQKFAWFIESKEFLPDSYTRFTNKIGLTHNGEFISKANDIVLDFPYKDCVLEGGQDKDDQKRKEIFYNETIAGEEISKMLAPKIFTNARRYTKDGVEENITFDENDNLIIKGNNLIALSTLLKRYEGKVKCIYIDPPYNTGSDSFGYNDKFNHSTWLTFMKNRLEIAKKMLRNDGVIFVQCDDNEQAYLKVLMDNIFDNNNFVNTIAVKMSESSGTKMVHVDKRLPKLKEYILLYKKETCKLNEVKIAKESWDDEYKTMITNLSKGDLNFIKTVCKDENRSVDDIKKVDDLLGKAKYKSLSAIYKENNITKKKDKEKYNFENSYRIFRTTSVSEKTTKVLVELKNQKNNEAFFTYVTPKNKVYVIKGDFDNDTNKPRTQVIFADEYLEYNPGDFWTDIKTTGLENEGAQLKNGKKPEQLIERIIKLSTKNNDLVLDFHLGSGTTCAVAHKMGRKYIGIEQMDYIQDITVERMKKVIDGEQGGISKAVDWQGGGSFVYCELLENANALIEQIQSATEENIYDVKESIYSDERIVPYITRDELKSADDEFSELTIEEKKQALIKLVDKNKLYINYSDIEDDTFNVSESDKKFTTSFYKGV